jgi:hypothetical protein
MRKAAIVSIHFDSLSITCIRANHREEQRADLGLLENWGYGLIFRLGHECCPDVPACCMSKGAGIV